MREFRFAVRRLVAEPRRIAHGCACDDNRRRTSQQVLTTPAGLTLYYLTSDVAATPKCSAACLTHWPPLLSTGTPVLPSGVSGTLTVVQNSNGSQVAFNGHLLYQFANDKAQGDAKGEGINAFGGTWHAATPGLTQM